MNNLDIFIKKSYKANILSFFYHLLIIFHDLGYPFSHLLLTLTQMTEVYQNSIAFQHCFFTFGHLHTYEIFTLIALLFYIQKKQYKVCLSDLCSITNLQSCLDINYNFSLLFLIFSLSVPYHLQQFMEPLLEFKRVYCWVYMLSFYFLYFALIRQIFYKT